MNVRSVLRRVQSSRTCRGTFAVSVLFCSVLLFCSTIAAQQENHRPYIVSLGASDELDYKNTVWTTCLGIVVDKEHVLTSAFCSGYEDNPNTSKFFSVFTQEPGLSKDERFVHVREVIFHPQFNHRSSDHDLALLRLEREVNLPLAPLVSRDDSEHIQPGNQISAIEVQWDTYDGIELLKQFEGGVTDPANCRKRSLNSAHELCISQATDEDDIITCSDSVASGAPILSSNGGDERVIAIEGGFFPVCHEDKSTAFTVVTRIAPHLDWIEEMTQRGARVSQVIEDIVDVHRRARRLTLRIARLSGHSFHLHSRLFGLKATLTHMHRALSDSSNILDLSAATVDTVNQVNIESRRAQRKMRRGKAWRKQMMKLKESVENHRASSQG